MSKCELLTFLGVLTRDDVSQVVSAHSAYLNSQLDLVDSYSPKKRWLNGKWSKVKQANTSVGKWETGVPLDLLKYVGAKSVAYPENFVSAEFKIRYFSRPAPATRNRKHGQVAKCTGREFSVLDRDVCVIS
jgi:2-oxoglutarate dehydrogenase complex dehydrogenase (E1) component-like enzyme